MASGSLLKKGSSDLMELEIAYPEWIALLGTGPNAGDTVELQNVDLIEDYSVELRQAGTKYSQSSCLVHLPACVLEDDMVSFLRSQIAVAIGAPVDIFCAGKRLTDHQGHLLSERDQLGDFVTWAPKPNLCFR